MVDPIGMKPAAIQNVRVETDDKSKVVSLQAVKAAEPTVVAETGARETAKVMAARPPVDVDRVREIRRALQEGRFPLVPATIADRLIAAQMLWARKNDAD